MPAPIPVPCFRFTERKVHVSLEAAARQRLLTARAMRTPIASLQRDERGKAAEADRIRKSVGRPGSSFGKRDLVRADKAHTAAIEAVEWQVGRDLALAGDIAEASAARCKAMDSAWNAYGLACRPAITALQAEIEDLTARLASACRVLAIARGDHIGIATMVTTPEKRVPVGSAIFNHDHQEFAAAVLAVRALLDRADGDQPLETETENGPVKA